MTEAMKCSYLLHALSPEYKEVKTAIYAAGQNLTWIELLQKLHAGKTMQLPHHQLHARRKTLHQDEAYTTSQQQQGTRREARGDTKNKVSTGRHQYSNPRCSKSSGPHWPADCPSSSPTHREQVHQHKYNGPRKSWKTSANRSKPGQHGPRRVTPSTPAWLNVYESSLKVAQSYGRITPPKNDAGSSKSVENPEIRSAFPVIYRKIRNDVHSDIPTVLDSGAANHHVSPLNSGLVGLSLSLVGVGLC